MPQMMPKTTNPIFIQSWSPKCSTTRMKFKGNNSDVLAKDKSMTYDKNGISSVNVNHRRKDESKEEILKKLRAANRNKINLSPSSRKSALQALSRLNRTTSSTSSIQKAQTVDTGNDHSEKNLTQSKFTNLISSSNHHTFSLPFGNRVGNDLGEYINYISKSGKTKNKKVSDNKIPGIKYICGVPQPVANKQSQYPFPNVKNNSTKKIVAPKIHTTDQAAFGAISLKIPDYNSNATSTSWISKTNLGPASRHAIEARAHLKSKEQKVNSSYLEEADAEDLDFIDDSGMEIEEDIGDWKNQLRSITKYYPGRYKNEQVNDKDMESNFREICSEEKISKKFGRLEDDKEMMIEQLRQENKKLKKRIKKSTN